PIGDALAQLGAAGGVLGAEAVVEVDGQAGEGDAGDPLADAQPHFDVGRREEVDGGPFAERRVAPLLAADAFAHGVDGGLGDDLGVDGDAVGAFGGGAVPVDRDVGGED